MSKQRNIKRRKIGSIVLTVIIYLAVLVLIMVNPSLVIFRLVSAFLATIIVSNIISKIAAQGDKL